MDLRIVGAFVCMLCICLPASVDSRCRGPRFECANKKCIPWTWQCNESDDCGDGSDETPNCRDPCLQDDNGGCDSRAACVSVQRKLRFHRYSCTCRFGYHGDGITCTAANPEPTCFANLNKHFHNLEYDQQVFHAKVEGDESTEAVARRIWMSHVRVSPLVKEEIGEDVAPKHYQQYMVDFKLEGAIDGPFSDTSEDVKKRLDAGMLTWDDQDAAKALRYLMKGHDSSAESESAFADCFFTKDTQKIELFSSRHEYGDVLGYVVTSRRQDGTLLALVNMEF